METDMDCWIEQNTAMNIRIKGLIGSILNLSGCKIIKVEKEGEWSKIFYIISDKTRIKTIWVLNRDIIYENK